MKLDVRKILIRLGLFVVIFCAGYALFHFQPIKKASYSMYASVAESVLKSTFDGAHIFIQRDKEKYNNLEIAFASVKHIEEQKKLARLAGHSGVDIKGESYSFFFSLLFTTFWLFLMSLILVTPMTLLRKLMAVGAGTVLYLGYSLSKMLLRMTKIFHQSESGITDLGEGTASFLIGIHDFLTLGVSSLVVVILWMLLSFAGRKVIL